METPTLFDPSHSTEMFGCSDAAPAADRERAQLRIRQLNEDRQARQDDDQRLARRRAAIARLRRRVSEADEIDSEYWEQRRATLQLIG